MGSHGALVISVTLPGEAADLQRPANFSDPVRQRVCRLRLYETLFGCFTPRDNIVGMYLSTQDITAPLWAHSTTTLRALQQRERSRDRGHAPFAYLGYCALLRDRIFALDFQRMDLAGVVGFLPFNTDANYAWVTVSAKASNDQLLAVSTLALASGTSHHDDNAIRGVSALGASGSVNSGDAAHYIVEAPCGFTDRWPHSLSRDELCVGVRLFQHVDVGAGPELAQRMELNLQWHLLY